MAEEIQLPLEQEFSSSHRWKQAISEPELRQKRDCLDRFFDREWFTIGWRLQRVKTREQVPSVVIVPKVDEDDIAMRPFQMKLSEEAVSEITSLMGEHEVAKFMSRLRSVRRAEFEAPTIIEVLSEQARRDAKALKRVRTALRGSMIAKHRTPLTAKRDVLRKQLRYGLQRRRELRKEMGFSKALNANAEAYFCQLQLAEFCNSGRYEISPRSLANALALVPYCGWRESALICNRWKIQNRSNYEMIKQITLFLDYCTSTVGFSSTFGRIAELSEKWLERKRSKPSAAIHSLRDNHEYFRRAIEQVHKRKLAMRSRPYAIARAYTRLCRNMSQEAALLRETESVLNNRTLFAPEELP